MANSRIFPWRDGNHFSLLINGEAFFPRMLSAIDSAENYILMEMYLFESGNLADRFIEAFSKAVNRGVKVFLLLDDFGSNCLDIQDKRKLADFGVRTASHNPVKLAKLRKNLHRNHRKLLIADGETAFTGGAGIADSFWNKTDPGHSWRETMVEVRGPEVDDWRISFEENWNHWAEEPLPALPGANTKNPGKMRGRVALTKSRHRQEIARSAVKRIRTAAQRIWISTAYFIPTWKIRRALCAASRRGCDVRLLLPGPRNDHPSIRHVGRQYFHRLLKNGVRIFEYQSRFMHSKVMICDQWVSIGSSNLDRWELRWNMDANQEITDQNFSAEAIKIFQDDFKSCVEIDAVKWLSRPWKDRILEKFWGSLLTRAEYFAQLKKPFHYKLSRKNHKKT